MPHPTALILGVSRSGATVTLGLFLGLRREKAARFSFSMSVPITAGFGALSKAKTMGEGMGEGMGPDQALLFPVGAILSAVVGYLATGFLLRYLARPTLRVFAYYRFALAAVVVALLLVARCWECQGSPLTPPLPLPATTRARKVPTHTSL
ncbi:MAG: undecaprenyl-diphosphate phosphatase [Actinomycetota bacterium]|nr:undecaprenyl-diphosphate phosphatase [Actinomycetota bacterium]